MTIHHKNLQTLAAPFKAVLFDVWGVLWDGKTLYGGVQDALAELHASAKKIAIVTNTTQLAQEVEEQYIPRGLIKGQHYDTIVTAGDISRERLLSGKFNQASLRATKTATYAVLGKSNPTLFAGTGMKEVSSIADSDFVYIGVPEKNGIRQLNVEAFTEDLQECLRHQRLLFCPNPDYYAPNGNVYEACQGLIAKTYEGMGGKVEWGGGKPFRDIFNVSLAQLGVKDPAQACMIGDTLRTDIAGANAAGIKTALVLQTGGVANDLRGGAKLDDLYQREQTRPDFTLPRVGKKLLL